MTYKTADQMFRRWVLLYMVHCLFGVTILLSGILERNVPIIYLGLMVGGSAVWSWQKMFSRLQVRRQVIEAWKKNFENTEFLLRHASRHRFFEPGFILRDRGPSKGDALWCISKLWSDRKSSESVHLDFRVRGVANNLGGDEAELYKSLLVGVLYRVIEPLDSEPRGFRIGQLVFQCAEERYPLEDFEIPVENNQTDKEHVLAI